MNDPWYLLTAPLVWLMSMLLFKWSKPDAEKQDLVLMGKAYAAIIVVFYGGASLVLALMVGIK